MTTNGKPKKLAKMGRPTLRSKALIDQLLECLENGGTVSGFCREPDTPAVRTVESWAESDSGLSAEIARARARGCDSMEQDYQDISNTPKLVEVKNGKKTAVVVHPDDVQHRKLQMHALEKRMSWNNPGKYGQKSQVDVTEKREAPEMSKLERGIRVRQVLEKAGLRVVEVEIGEPKEDDHHE